MRGVSDLIAVVERAYDMDADDGDWLTAVATELCPPFNTSTGVAAFVASLEAIPSTTAFREVGTVPGVFRSILDRGNASMPDLNELVRAYKRLGAITGLDAMDPSAENRRFLQQMFRDGGYEDCACLLAYDGGHESAVFTSMTADPLRFSARAKRVWRRLATHVASGLRLRRSLSAGARPKLDRAEAILRSDGRVEHATDRAEPRSMRQALRDAARAADRARGRMRATDPELALELWRGLVAGRWTLLDHFDSDGRRFVVALRNEPEPSSLEALSSSQRQVVEYASLGLANKEIAYALGLPTTTVNSRLATALRKLGGINRTELCSVVSSFDEARRSLVMTGSVHVEAVSREVRETTAVARLSAGERQVLQDAVTGRTNSEIARRRGVSARTIANQLAAAYRKLGVRSRTEAAVLLARSNGAKHE